MFIFKTNDGLIVTCSNAGTYDPSDSKRTGGVFHLEQVKKPNRQGYAHCAECIYSTPEEWIEFFKLQYNWVVYPVKLIEVEWE